MTAVPRTNPEAEFDQDASVKIVATWRQSIKRISVTSEVEG